MLSLRYSTSPDIIRGGSHSPKKVRYPPFVLSFTQTHLCDTPFCSTSRDKLCDAPSREFCDTWAQVLRDMKSMASGPLSPKPRGSIKTDGFQTGKFFKVVRLQSEVCTKDFFLCYELLTKNAPIFSPKCSSLYSVGQKIPQNSRQFSHQISLQNI